MVVATAGSLLMTVVGKGLVGRIRPPLADAVPPYETSPAFPSGHALNAVVVAGVIAYLLMLRQRRWRTRVCEPNVPAPPNPGNVLGRGSNRSPRPASTAAPVPARPPHPPHYRQRESPSVERGPLPTDPDGLRLVCHRPGKPSWTTHWPAQWGVAVGPPTGTGAYGGPATPSD
ncbi:MAG TPA: phosphatase PAP2 family protein, partial [Catenuloplanes sp.]